MNLRQTGRISLLSVALNIITCFSWGVSLKISWTSRLMSAGRKKNSFKNTSIALVNRFYSVYKVEPFFKLFFFNLLLLLTQLLQHFITLIKHKVFDVLQAEALVVDEGQGTSRSSDDNVRTVLLQDFLVLLDGQATKEHGHLDTGHVLGEALILFADLEGQLSSVAHYKNRHLE